MVDDELDRLTRVTERLVRAIRLQGDADVDRVDLDLVLRQTVERWAQVAERRWVVEPRAGWCEGSVERMRASLDTLVENALRYTVTGDVIRVTGHRDASTVTIGVADSGAGLSPEQVAAINGTGDVTEPPRDALSQTGLGLGLVRGVAAARGGRLVAGTAPGGGRPHARAPATATPRWVRSSAPSPTRPSRVCQARPAPPPVVRSSCTPDGPPPYAGRRVRSANTARTPDGCAARRSAP